MNKDNMLLFCAFRYALGRQTYVVSLIVDEIIERWDSLDEVDRSQYKKEIKEALDMARAGADMDEKQWKRILEL